MQTRQGSSLTDGEIRDQVLVFLLAGIVPGPPSAAGGASG